MVSTLGIAALVVLVVLGLYFVIKHWSSLHSLGAPNVLGATLGKLMPLLIVLLSGVVGISLFGSRAGVENQERGEGELARQVIADEITEAEYETKRRQLDDASDAMNTTAAAASNNGQWMTVVTPAGVLRARGGRNGFDYDEDGQGFFTAQSYLDDMDEDRAFAEAPEHVYLEDW